MTDTIERAISEAIAAGANRAMARELGNHSGLLKLAEEHRRRAKVRLREFVEGPTYPVIGRRPLFMSRSWGG